MIANLVFRVILDLTEILFTPENVAFLKSITNLCQFCLSLLLTKNKINNTVLMFNTQFYKHALTYHFLLLSEDSRGGGGLGTPQPVLEQPGLRGGRGSSRRCVALTS